VSVGQRKAQCEVSMVGELDYAWLMVSVVHNFPSGIVKNNGFVRECVLYVRSHKGLRNGIIPCTSKSHFTYLQKRSPWIDLQHFKVGQFREVFWPPVSLCLPAILNCLVINLGLHPHFIPTLKNTRTSLPYLSFLQTHSLTHSTQKCHFMYHEIPIFGLKSVGNVCCKIESF